MNNYLSLLLTFQALPRTRQRSTFMEIAGYPHYENVCSNILKFYLEPKGEHGLGNLLLTAFLRMAGKPTLEIPDQVSVEREYQTKEETRIDLVIDCESFTLGIENKIYHWEANDFEIYAKTLEDLGKDKQVIKAVLCLKASPTAEQPKGGFVRYTYRELWRHVRDLLGHHLPGADPKWTIYLNEFMETTTRLAGETPDEKEITDFFMQHYEVIEKLVEDRQRILNLASKRIRNIEAVLQGLPETSKYLARRFVWEKNCLASYFTIQGSTIGIDLWMDLKGWSLSLFERPHPTAVLSRLVTSPAMVQHAPNPPKHGERYLLQLWDLHASEIEIQEALIIWTKAMISAADEMETTSSLEVAPRQIGEGIPGRIGASGFK